MSTADNTKSYLEMSDEELIRMGAPAASEEPEEESEVVEPESEEDTAPEAEEVNEELAKQAAKEDAQEDAEDEAQQAEEQTESLDDAGEKLLEAPKADEAKEEPAIEVDYKKEYDRLIAPFKANGKDIAVNSVDDAIALMQMGANYNKKMSALKPNLKLMKMLENNGLLNEDKLGFLIDLDKKNPQAINKLMKDSGIDPMDLDAEKAGEYKAPTTYRVQDTEMELDTVLDSIQDTPTYNRTLDVLGSKWDGASKQVIADSPQLVKVINDHMQSGIYDAIAKEVERERVFGRLNGLSDIDAYRQVGDAMQSRGGFNHLAQAQRQGQQTQPVARVVTPAPKADDSKLRDKKRAASPSKPSSQGQSTKDYNPLALSDEAFNKLINDRLL